LAFFPDGRRLAVLTPGITYPGKNIQIWNVDTGEKLLNLPVGVEETVTALAVSADGKTLVSADWKCVRQSDAAGNLNLWEVSTGRRLRRLSWEGMRPDCLALSPDGATAEVGGASDKELIRIWDLQKGKEIAALALQQQIPYLITSLAFSPDGRLLVSGDSNRAVRLWEVATGQEVFTLQGHSREIAAVAFSPNGRLVASGSGVEWHSDTVPERQSIRLWDAFTGAEVPHRLGQPSPVISLAFSSNGSQLASGERNSTVLIWDVTAASATRPRGAQRLDSQELEALWQDLAGADARKARLAIGTLAGVPGQAIAFLQGRLKPTPAPDPERVRHMIADLDSERFDVRDQATKELERLSELAEPSLGQALEAQGLSLESRRRLEQLLKKLDGPVRDPWQRQALRAIEVLERVGTPEARQVLKTLTQGAPEARLTKEAKASLDRLGKR
jgi:hypothetical protein